MSNIGMPFPPVDYLFFQTGTITLRKVFYILVLYQNFMHFILISSQLPLVDQSRKKKFRVGYKFPQNAYQHDFLNLLWKFSTMTLFTFVTYLFQAG